MGNSFSPKFDWRMDICAFGCRNKPNCDIFVLFLNLPVKQVGYANFPLAEFSRYAQNGRRKAASKDLDSTR